MERDNTWPPAGFDPNLPADHQGINDPGNSPDDDELEEDPDYDLDDDSDLDIDEDLLLDNLPS